MESEPQISGVVSAQPRDWRHGKYGGLWSLAGAILSILASVFALAGRDCLIRTLKAVCCRRPHKTDLNSIKESNDWAFVLAVETARQCKVTTSQEIQNRLKFVRERLQLNRKPSYRSRSPNHQREHLQSQCDNYKTEPKRTRYIPIPIEDP